MIWFRKLFSSDSETEASRLVINFASRDDDRNNSHVVYFIKKYKCFMMLLEVFFLERERLNLFDHLMWIAWLCALFHSECPLLITLSNESTYASCLFQILHSHSESNWFYMTTCGTPCFLCALNILHVVIWGFYTGKFDQRYPLFGGIKLMMCWILVTAYCHITDMSWD